MQPTVSSSTTRQTTLAIDLRNDCYIDSYEKFFSVQPSIEIGKEYFLFSSSYL